MVANSAVLILCPWQFAARGFIAHFERKVVTNNSKNTQSSTSDTRFPVVAGSTLHRLLQRLPGLLLSG